MPYIILKGEMAKHEVTIEMIAELLQIHRNSVSNKINGGKFTIDESILIRDAFFPGWDLEKLFSKEDNK